MTSRSYKTTNGSYTFFFHVSRVAMAQIGADRGLINPLGVGLRFGPFAS